MACINNFLIVWIYTENGIVILNQRRMSNGSEQLNVINQVELDLNKDMIDDLECLYNYVIFGVDSVLYVYVNLIFPV